MKKKNSQLIKALLFFIAGLFCFTNKSFSQNWDWANSFGGVSSESGLVIKAVYTPTPNNAVEFYVAGTFSSTTITFNTTSAGTQTFTNKGGLDIFVLKYNIYGSLVCALTMGGSGNDIPTGIVSTSSSLFNVCGYFNGPSISNAIGSVSVTNVNPGTNDIFIANCNDATSSLSVTKFLSYGGTGDDRATGISNQGTYAVTGNFTSPTFTAGTYTLTNTNSSGTSNDIFIIYFSNITAPSVLGVVNTGGPNSDDYSNGIVSGGSGRATIVGNYLPLTNTTVIGGGVVTSAGGWDMFVAQYSVSTSFAPVLWVRNGGSAGVDRGNGIAIDGSNNLYITGTYSNSSMVIGTSTLSNSGLNDVFVAKYSNLGALTWASKTGGADNEYSNSITSDGFGNTYIAGGFGSSTLVTGTSTLANAGPLATTDIFIEKRNTTGVPQWGLAAQGINNEISNSLFSDYGGNVYSTGLFTSPTTFSTPSITTLNSSGNSDAYVSRISCGSITVTASSNTICTGGSSTLTAVGATNYNWSGGASSTTSVCVLNNPILPFVNITYTIGTCVNTTSFSIVVNQNPTTANAGPTQNRCISSPSTTMSGNIPSVGTGSWTLVSGSGAITTPTLQNTTVTGLGLGTNIFQWTISNPPCASSSSTVAINVSNVPTTSNAGPTQTVCPSSSSITTAANTPAIGSGSWSVVSGSGTIANSFSPVTTITGLGAGTNVFAWTISNPPCASSVSNLTVTVVPASINAGANFNLVCKQQQVISATTNPPSPTSVVWTPTTGLSSSTVLNPTAKGTGSNIIYTVTCVLSNGCIPPASTVSVGTTTITKPDICQVTVDSLSVNNEIFWDKSLYPNADSFFVYRETSTSVYTKIARLSRTSLSMYADTNRSIGPFNGNPNLTAYKYKLQYKDSCGALSPLSLWHQTIFVQDQLNGNFNWTQYTIESTTLTPVSSYNLKRRDLATGTETLVVSTGTNVATDPNWATFWPTNVKWFVDATGFNCNVTAKVSPGNETMVLKAKTKSNQSNDKQFATNIYSSALSENILIYPNPAQDILNVDLNGLEKNETTVEILNTIGQVVCQTKSINQKIAINTSGLAGGVYIVNIKQNEKTIAIKKVVIER